MQPSRGSFLKGGDLLEPKNTQDPSGSQALQILLNKARTGSLGDFLRDWKWILSFTKDRWPRIFVSTLLGIFSSLLTLASGVAGKYLIDCIVELDKEVLLPLAAAMILFTFLSLGLQSLTSRFAARLGVTMRNDVQAHVFHKLLHARWLEIRRFSTGDLLNRFSVDVNTVASCAVGWLPNVIIQLFTLGASLLVMLYYDPVMALIAFASTPILFFASRRLLRKQRHFTQKFREAGSHMSAFEAETWHNVDTLKSFGVEDDMDQKLGIFQERYRKIALEYNDFSIRTNILLTLLGMAVQFLALGYCLWQLWSGRILFGTMVLFLQQRSTLSSAFSSLLSLIPTALNGSVSAERLRELTDLEQESQQQPLRVRGKCALELNNVSVSYEDKRQVLKNVDLKAEPAQIVALVGPSGEGKSTLIRLMLGLISPDSGSVQLEDASGTRYPLGADTRQLFAYVPQGNTVLAGTIADNLRLANHEVTEAQMVQALKDACAWEFVSRLPQGLHSPIGEGGKGFSEGQAQRIAIARALVRNAPFMLLDEVTSALDLETEQQVLKNLTSRGVTCIMATHRPSVLSLCARVYKVSDGRLYPLTEDQIHAIQYMEI